VPAPSWDFAVEAGDPAEVCGLLYIFERFDADGTVTFRSPAGSDAGDFMVEDSNGRFRKPTIADVAALERDGQLIWREKPLSNEARRCARALDLAADQARSMDPKAQFRMAIVRRFDRDPWSRSDASLKGFMSEALEDPEINGLPMKWPACPSSVRTWLAERGTEGCRKERDGVSMKNRKPHIRKLEHPLEILFYHAARATNVRGSVTDNHNAYVAEIARINAGEALNRQYYDFESGRLTPREAAYPAPATPYVAISFNRFWRLCQEIKSEKAYGRKTTPRAVYQRYGGGGRGDLPTHLGALCSMDSTPVPKAFFVDDATSIPIGAATMTLMLEHRSKVVPGWDLCPGACNSSAVLRTVLCASSIKTVPAHLLKIDPNLPYLRLRPEVIAFDNATEHHGRTVEENLADAYIGTDFVGADMARDKAPMERIMGTFLDLLLKHQPDAAYDVERMRLYGFDPEKEGHVLCSIQTGRRLLALAVMTYNVSRNRGADKRQPALVWRQLIAKRKLNVLRDVDEFKRNIGIVDRGTFTNAGLEKFNRRYTPGALEMRRIVADFERGTKLRKGDTSPAPKKSRNDKKRPTHKVKIRYDEDDIGMIRVWNPHAQPARWEEFHCIDPAAYGAPLWLHQRCLELAEREAMDYLSPQGQAIVRARLYEEIANTDSQAAERERRTMGQALADPRVRQVMAGYVEVTDEQAEDLPQPGPEEHEPVDHGLSTGKRRDEGIDTPRQKLPEPKAPVAMSRPSRSSETPATTGDQNRAPSAPAPRRTAPEGGMNADRRHPTAHQKSADRADQRQAPYPRSNRLRWGDDF
jgi:hypothetical protein